MSTIIADLAEVVPLYLQLADGVTSLFPQAVVYDESGSPVGSPLDLLHVASGLYRVTFTVPSAQKFVVRYDVYTDAGHTIIDTDHERVEDIIIADMPQPDASTIADAVWDELRSGHGLSGSFGEAMRVLLGSQGKANVRFDLFVYDANGFLTSCRVRIFPSAAVAAASTMGGVGEGEIHTITVTGVPDGTFNVLPDTMLGTLAP